MIPPKTIYDAYPDSDLLLIEPPHAGETIRDFDMRVSEPHGHGGHACGDTLFVFLCHEANEDMLTPAEYIGRLDRAILDLEAVKLAIMAADQKGA